MFLRVCISVKFRPQGLEMVVQLFESVERPPGFTLVFSDRDLTVQPLAKLGENSPSGIQLQVLDFFDEL